MFPNYKFSNGDGYQRDWRSYALGREGRVHQGKSQVTEEYCCAVDPRDSKVTHTQKLINRDS